MTASHITRETQPLEAGSHIRVVAPSRSLHIIGEDRARRATEKLAEIGLEVSFGEHAWSHDEYESSSVEARVHDIHSAFASPEVDGIMTAIGGYNSNELLKSIDYDLIAANQKFFCGYSDITALLHAFVVKAGAVGYYGPHFSSFSMKQGVGFMISSFREAAFSRNDLHLEPSEYWSDDEWYLHQDDRTFHRNEGPLTIRSGHSSGQVVGGYLRGFTSLFGSEYAPNLEGKIVLIEETGDTNKREFKRQLTSLMQQPHAQDIAGLLIGRLPSSAGVDNLSLQKLFEECVDEDIPIVGNLQFGHTMPIATIPIGGNAQITADAAHQDIRFKR